MAMNQDNGEAPDKGEVEMGNQLAARQKSGSKTNEIFSQLTGEQKNTSKVS